MNTTISLLLVDDHPTILYTLKDILEEEGFTVVTASTGLAAIESCRKNSFDVIVMDVCMPGFNGIETFKRIKSISQGAKVFLMSAFTLEEIKQEALKEGAIAFLQKPVDIDNLLLLLHTIKQQQNSNLLEKLDDIYGNS